MAVRRGVPNDQGQNSQVWLIPRKRWTSIGAFYKTRWMAREFLFDALAQPLPSHIMQAIEERLQTEKAALEGRLQEQIDLLDTTMKVCLCKLVATQWYCSC